MTDPFDDPAEPSGGIDWKTLANRLVLFHIISNEAGIKTVHGVKDAVRADVVVLDGPEAGKKYDNTLVFPGVLIGQLKAKVGKQVLGRLGYGEAKPGQNPPWKLSPATDQDKATGQRYLASPLANPAPVPDDPWGASGDKPPF